MTLALSCKEATDHWDDTIDWVAGGVTVAITRYGRPLVVLVPYHKFVAIPKDALAVRILTVTKSEVRRYRPGWSGSIKLLRSGVALLITYYREPTGVMLLADEYERLKHIPEVRAILDPEESVARQEAHAQERGPWGYVDPHPGPRES